MKITRKEIRKILKEALLNEKKEMLPIIVNEYENVEDYNILANYALNNDIQGALADPVIKPYWEKNEMGWVADEAGGWWCQSARQIRPQVQVVGPGCRQTPACCQPSQ